MSYASLLQKHSAVLGYCVAFTFGSSLGQTFFISLFMPAVAESTGTSLARLATLYSVATVLSALALPSLGRLIDRMDIVRYGLWAGAGAMCASLLMASATHMWTVLAAMCLLRLFGLGLMSHVGWTGAGRYFVENRGRALSVVGLGHSAAEAVLPLLVVAAVAAFGWRSVYACAGVLVACMLIPAASMLVRRNDTFRIAPHAVGAQNVSGQRYALLRSKAFWIYLPLIVASPLALTALLFFQGHIAEAKQLPLEVFAAGFIGFAIVQLPASILIGHLIDRHGAALPLALHLLPLGLGCALLAWSSTAWAAWAFLTLAGITTAASSILRTAIAAELVSPDQLGEARSLISSILVLAAAAGPVIYGWPISAGATASSILWSTLAFVLIAAVPAALHFTASSRPRSSLRA